MRRSLRPLLGLLLPLLAGCMNRETIPAVAESPPPTGVPRVPDSAAIRPAYSLQDKQAVAGTGFLIKDAGGNLYFLTAAHVMDDEAEWRSVTNLTLANMAGTKIGSAKPADLKWIGKPFDKADTTWDLTIWEPTFDRAPEPLTLASEDPKQNEWVWVAGRPGGQRGPQKLFRCKVTGAESGGVTLRQDDLFQLRGFSGGPVLDPLGNVVGTVLGGREPNILCSKVSAIRKRLAEAGIQVP